MDLRRSLRRQARYLIAPIIGFGVSGYFAYHLIEGDRGLIAWVQLTQQIRAAKQQQIDTHLQRQAIERRVALLHPEHMDPDLLDEQARAALNLIGPGEVVIMNKDPGSAPTTN